MDDKLAELRRAFNADPENKGLLEQARRAWARQFDGQCRQCGFNAHHITSLSYDTESRAVLLHGTGSAPVARCCLICGLTTLHIDPKVLPEESRLEVLPDDQRREAIEGALAVVDEVERQTRGALGVPAEMVEPNPPRPCGCLRTSKRASRCAPIKHRRARI